MKNINLLLICLGLSFSLGCTKDFLDERPSKALLVPQTLADMQALLDNINVMNSTPAIPALAADDYSLLEGGALKIDAVQNGAYFWAEDTYQGNSVGDWTTPYQQIFYSNVVLDGLEQLQPTNQELSSYNSIKGSAYFYKAMALNNLLQLFAKPYDLNANNNPGLPVPLNSNVNERPERKTLSYTYEQLILNLQNAANLLPLKASTKNRPSLHAVYALLARVYLQMQDYAQAEAFAEKALNISRTLIDYNTATATTTPFGQVLPNGMEEVIFYNKKLSYAFFTSGIIKIDPSLVNLYQANDLRKRYYFRDGSNGSVSFTGYEGLTTDELYLISAECKARRKDTHGALGELNVLLLKRWKTGTYVNLSASTADEALSLVLNERRKELAGRGLRWGDLRRLNQDSRFAITLNRTYGGKTYTLPPNDKKYTLPIPDKEIQYGTIEQN